MVARYFSQITKELGAWIFEEGILDSWAISSKSFEGQMKSATGIRQTVFSALYLTDTARRYRWQFVAHSPVYARCKVKLDV